MATVAARLQECRERSGRTFRELATLTGFSAGHLANVHNGKETATLELLTRLAPIYGTTVAWLRDGDERVNVWLEFRSSSHFVRVNNPTANPSDRVAAVVTYLEEHMPGHLTRRDLARYMDISLETLSKVTSGERQPSRDFCELLSQISGVPASWIELGPLASLKDLAPLNSMTVDEIRQLLELGARAKAAGVSIDKLASIVEALAK